MLVAGCSKINDPPLHITKANNSTVLSYGRMTRVSANQYIVIYNIALKYRTGYV